MGSADLDTEKVIWGQQIRIRKTPIYSTSSESDTRVISVIAFAMIIHLEFVIFSDSVHGRSLI